MRTTILILIFFAVCFCIVICVSHCSTDSAQAGDDGNMTSDIAITALNTTADAASPIVFSDSALIAFVNAVNTISPQQLTAPVKHFSDSVFRSPCNFTAYKIKNKDEDELQFALRTKMISATAAKRIFRNANKDDESRNTNNDSISITIYSFSGNADALSECIITPGTGLPGDNMLLVLKRVNDTLFAIACHHQSDENNFELNHFPDSDGKTIFYYTEQFASGEGISQTNYFFYKICGLKVLPVLNELKSAELQMPWIAREHSLQATIVATNPLRIKMTGNIAFHDSCSMCEKNFASDSTVIIYSWDLPSHSLTADFQSNAFTSEKVLSFSAENDELLFVHAYGDAIIRTLQSGDEKKKHAVQLYLSGLKKSFAQL